MKLVAAASLVLLGCSATVSHEVADARAAYVRATQGPAATYDVEDLAVARRELSAAETSLHDLGNIAATRDLAYVARRRAEIADTRARDLAARDQRVELTSARLDATPAPKTTDDLAVATQKLAPIGKLRLRGPSLVVSIPTHALFMPNAVDVNVSALDKIDVVARVLLHDLPTATVSVDAGPSDLARDRTESIQADLVARGVPRARFTPAADAQVHLVLEP